MKHKSEVVHDGETFIYHYVKGMEFINQAPASVYLSEGRYTWEREDDGTLVDEYYEWCIKDHLGNTRVKFADKNGDGGILYNPEAPEEDEILGTYHYYPFGMEMEGVWTPDSKPEMQYLYNGKEQVKGLGWYDYGARYYNPSIGRFTSLDPLADAPHLDSYSPYHYSYNNPINYIDPDGRSPIKGLKALYNVGKKAYKSYRKTGKVDIGKALKSEVVDIVDNVSTLADGTLDGNDVIAVIDLVTGFGDEAKKLAKYSDKAVDVKKGRGSNKRKPDSEAEGAHSVYNDRGNTTYTKNDKNPSGFDEVKRTDTEGKAHTNKDGTKVETPHVHTKGEKDVRPAVKGKDY